MRKTLEKDKQNQRLKEELNLTKHIALSVRSTTNVIRFYLLLRQLAYLRCEPVGVGFIRPAGLMNQAPTKGNSYTLKLQKKGEEIAPSDKKNF